MKSIYIRDLLFWINPSSERLRHESKIFIYDGTDIAADDLS